MPVILGPSVLNCKANLSLDLPEPLGHTVRMAESAEEQYKQEFMQRTREARVGRGWKQWQAAEALGIPQDQYKQYEKRGMMPHRMIVRFCLVCRVELEWFLTGHGKRALQPLTIAESPERPIKAPKAKAQRKRAKTAA